MWFIVWSQESKKSSFPTEDLSLLSLWNKGTHWKIVHHLGTTQGVEETQPLCIGMQIISQTLVKTKILDEEQETDNDANEVFFKIKVSSVWARVKELFTWVEFADPNIRHEKKFDYQLHTGVTCNVLTHHNLSVICQTGHPALQRSKVNLWLFNGTVIKPDGEVSQCPERSSIT